MMTKEHWYLILGIYIGASSALMLNYFIYQYNQRTVEIKFPEPQPSPPPPPGILR